MRLVGVVVLLGQGSCATKGGQAEEEMEAGGTMRETQRRADLPSYLSAGVKRGGFEGIAFGDAAWEILPGEREKLKVLAMHLKVTGERVIVAGGAQVTSAEYARQLGQQRALAVRQALMKEGIPGSRIVTVSFGLDLPGKGGDRVEFGTVPTGEKGV